MSNEHNLDADVNAALRDQCKALRTERDEATAKIDALHVQLAEASTQTHEIRRERDNALIQSASRLREIEALQAWIERIRESYQINVEQVK